MEPPPRVTYYNEVRSMLFAFGDNHKPNPETTKFVESIVLKQLRLIVQEALKYWDGKTLKGEDLVFLMRRNKWKMRRFVQYLHNKEFSLQQELEAGGEVEGDNKGALKATLSKRSLKNDLLKFIEKIDETGELTDLSELDTVKRERQMRAERISVALDERTYLEFHRARCTSFNSKEISRSSSDRLQSWIDPRKEIVFGGYAIDVLFYYAYETVAQIVDYALLVRSDSRRTKDPLARLSESHYTATMFSGEHKFGTPGATPDYSKVYAGNGRPPISVSEIREVLRRFGAPNVGYFNLGGGRIPPTRYLFAL